MVVRQGLCVGIWVGLFSAAVACGGGANDDPSPKVDPDVGSDGGTSGIEEECSPRSCECPNGLVGETECPSEACRCDHCPAFEPEAVPDFSPCGGDLWGLWREDKSRSEGFVILVTTGERRTCSAELVSAIPAIEVLEISDGGSGRVYGTRQDLVATAPNSCLGVAGGCESLEGADCVLEDCGLCRCSMAVDAFSREVMWETRDEKWLDLVTTVGFEAFGQTFGYCVKGDTLELGTSETGVEHVFERVYRAGVPRACADREADRCVGPGCHWGECIGTGRCEGSESEADCLTRQDCEWDPDSCWGTGSEWCYADDYGRVTGCELIDEEPVCGGTALPCIDQNLVDFTDVSGCTASDDDVCVGGSHPCEDNFIEIPECVCDDDGLCEGTYSCETLSRYNCTSEYACEWRTNVAVGTPTPCEELEPETCTRTKGCFLTAP